MPARLAYLLSQYPAVNHVFMLRELRTLRAGGVDVRVASIRPPDRGAGLLTAAEREEAGSTFYVKRAGRAEFLLAHVATLLRTPRLYLRGLDCALRGAGISPRKWAYGLFYFTEALVVGRWMRRNGLQHLHTHFASGVALIVARAFPVTMSATFHGVGELGDPTAFRLAEKVRASLFACAVSRHGLSQLMYVSPPAEWPKLELTPLGVDVAEFAPVCERPAGACFELVTVGSLAPVKGQHVLIDAIDRMTRAGHEVRLRIVGDGPERGELEAEAARRGLGRAVVFEGSLNQEQLKLVYMSADTFVLPSFGEGLPVVLMEAMAMELPCVATWVAGIPELIRDGRDGLLVPAGDAAALSEALVRLMADPALRRRLGESGRRRVLEGYQLDVNASALAKVFERRLDGRA